MQAQCKVRFDFTTIDSPYYIGGMYDPLIVLTDIEKKLPAHIKKSQYKKDKGSAKVSAEYFISYDDSNFPKQEKEGSFERFVGRDPYETLLESDVELVKNLIKKTYGISKDENNKIEHKIILEDLKLIKA
jgi:ferric iron reductase protein FhuF